MSHAITIPADVCNPGQFFASCALLELAGRVWRHTTVFFRRDNLVLESPDASDGLPGLLERFQKCELSLGASEDAESGEDDDDEGRNATPMSLGPPFNLTLDWWGDKALKPWAGSMNAGLIFKAMRSAISAGNLDPLNDLRVVRDEAPASTRTRRSGRPKKREPFYFDSRRGSNAKSLDVGFAPDAFSMTTLACPAVESLCMVGLQRFRPAPTGTRRVFDYWTWSVPLPPALAAAAVCGILPGVCGERYRFENAFRTDQRKHKGFLAATLITEGDTP
jgi:CRISPR-associated protein Csb3